MPAGEIKFTANAEIIDIPKRKNISFITLFNCMLAFSLFNRYALTECTEEEKEMQRLPAFRFCGWDEYFAQ
jgi:hypothetical protein